MNHKRPRDDDHRGRSNPSKKPKHYDRGDGHRAQNDHNELKPYQPAMSPTSALAALPPPTTTLPTVPPYTPFTTSPNLPSLPPILDPSLTTAPFRHKSTLANHTRTAPTPSTAQTTSTNPITYENLEFLGDAYLELLASRLLYTHFPHLPAGHQSQLRELLVKNSTLASFALAYKFDTRVQVGDRERMERDARARGNKGFDKVLGDVFEAYLAAVVLGGGDEGFAVAEKWMQGLWAPRLAEVVREESGQYFTPGLNLTRDDGKNAGENVYDPAAKAELQKRVLAAGTKLEYEPYRASVELKGDKIGQNRHFIAVYLTGWGYERKLLGKGEGRNKVEAGNYAASDAMRGEARDLVAECEKKLTEGREAKKREREAKEAREKKEGGG
ncbi:hypothetical protein B0A50_02096 [Salinomyces thailandicus]|uniref:RNase III domain-containing protein n=1 Tax=Salinomyces thailandicus TaxID=706561 RepID=A0A4U0U7W2_9PEZI|nr:hypothetical protein B0A50_02096 [Salinomyces thailandica]